MLRSARYPFTLSVIEQTPGRGPGAARNLALSAADAKIVLFLDDDVVPATQLVEVHASHHAERADLVVIGPLLPPGRGQQPWIRWEGDTLLKQYAEMETGAWAPSPRQFYTGNASVMREHLVDAGGFHEGLRRGEDVELALRLERRGLTFLFEPRAVAVHIARRSFASWLDAAYEYGRSELTMRPAPGFRGLVEAKADDFQRRDPLVRWVVARSLAFPSAAPWVIFVARVVGRAMAAVHIWRLARGAYTTIFELAYWRGVELALGPRGASLALLRAGRERASNRRQRSGLAR